MVGSRFFGLVRRITLSCFGFTGVGLREFLFRGYDIGGVRVGFCSLLGFCL